MVVLGDLASCFLFWELSWASRESLDSTGRWSYYPCFLSPATGLQACITEDQHPLFWSWDGYINTKSKHCLSRLYFEDLKFPFGGHGIQIKQGTWLRGRMQLPVRKSQRQARRIHMLGWAPHTS